MLLFFLPNLCLKWVLSTGLTLCQLQDAEIMNKFVAIAMALIAALTGVAQAQTSGNEYDVLENASVLTRQQQRMDILEAGLKEVRGILENDLREIKIKVEQVQNSNSEAGSSQTADLMRCATRWKS